MLIGGTRMAGAVAKLVFLGALASATVHNNAPPEATSEDLFSSTFEMSKLLEVEMTFSNNLLKYSKALKEQLDRVESVLSHVYPDGALQIDDPEEHVANPLNGFGMLNRLGARMLETPMGGVEEGAANLTRLEGKLRNATKVFPTLDNYHDGLAGLALLQDSYSLNLTALAEGTVAGPQSAGSFASDFRPTWEELAELAGVTCFRGWMDTCIDLYEMALARGEAEGGERKELDRLAAELDRAKASHDQVLDRRGPVGSNHRCHPIPYDPKLAKKKKYREAKRRRKEGKKMERMYNRVPLGEEVKHHRELSDNFQLMCGATEEELEREWRPPGHHLRCYRLHQGQPHLRLGPIKLEEVHGSPYVAVLRDFLHESEMEYLRNVTVGKMVRSRTGTNSDQRSTLIRTSKQAWLEDRFFPLGQALKDQGLEYEEDSLLPPPLPFDPMQYMTVSDRVAFGVGRRMQSATGLLVHPPFASENFQIANYGLGGQYSVHHDSNGFYDNVITARKDPSQYKHNRAVGDRMVTLMGYLSDVAYGGATVFPALGVSIPVGRGDVAAWFGLRSDGKKDKLAYHGGCPVVIGSKWITNKWVFYNDQFLNYPCQLERGSRYDILERWRRGHGIRI